MFPCTPQALAQTDAILLILFHKKFLLVGNEPLGHSYDIQGEEVELESGNLLTEIEIGIRTSTIPCV